MDGLQDTSCALQAYGIMPGYIIDEGGRFSDNLSSGICLIPDFIVEKPDCQIDEVEKLISNNAKADKASLSSSGQLCKKITAPGMKIMQETGQPVTAETI